MKSYYIKYGILFLITVILIDIVLFFTTDHKKEIDMSSLLILGQAIEEPLDKGDISKVNNIIDIYPENIIVEREGNIYTSNFGKRQIDRNSLATEQIENYRSFWQPLILSADNSSQTIYYKTREINYTNKIMMNTLFSFALALCSIPVLIFSLRDVDSLYDSIDHLRQYLVAAREQLEEIKNTKIIENHDKTSENDKLHKKLADSKNKRLALQKEVEKYKHDLEKRNEDVHSLRESINTMKSDMQNSKVDKTRLEEAKNIAIKEKQEIAKKLGQLELTIKAKDDEISRVSYKIKELNQVIDDVRKHLQERENDIQKLKVSKIEPREFENLRNKNIEIQREINEKNDDIRNLLAQLESKNVNIENLKDNISQSNLERLRMQNELNGLKTKTAADREVIQALVNENSQYKDKIIQLEDKLKEEIIIHSAEQKGDAYLSAEQKRLNIILKDKDNQIAQLIEESKQKENELKEFTLDTLDKLSALKRYEAQIMDMSRETLQKNNMIDSLETRLNVKDKTIDALNRELTMLKDKMKNVTTEIKAVNTVISTNNNIGQI